MNMILVNSVVIRAVGYDKNTETMRMELVSGAIYDYYEVPQSVYEKLMRSPSKGEYLNEYIKTKYSFDLVKGAIIKTKSLS